MPIDRTLDTRDLLERLLDKGIILDVWRRVASSGIDLTARRISVVSGESLVDPAEPVSLRIMRQAFEAWNDRNVDRYVSFLHLRYRGVVHGIGAPIRGRKGARRALNHFVKTFPDLSFQIVGVLAHGDIALVSWLARGTPGEPEAGPESVRRLEVHGCTVGDVKRGRIVRDWNYWDTNNMIRYVGQKKRREKDGPPAGDRLSAAS